MQKLDLTNVPQKYHEILSSEKERMNWEKYFWVIIDEKNIKYDDCENLYFIFRVIKNSSEIKSDYIGQTGYMPSDYAQPYIGEIRRVTAHSFMKCWAKNRIKNNKIDYEECDLILDSTSNILINYVNLSGSLNQFTKLISLMSELYQINPEWVVNNMKQMNADVKLNRKMNDVVPDKETRRKLYSAMNFFDELIKKKTGYVKAYKIASKHYNISEKLLKNVIGARNGFRSIKI